MDAELYGELERSFSAEGRKIAVCAASRGGSCLEAIESLREKGSLGREFFENYFSWMKPLPTLEKPASILIVAAPQARSILVLDLPKGSFEATIPATYLAEGIEAKNRVLLGSSLDPRGYAFEHAALPVKILAARAGLGLYGLDNILRVPGMGSYARLDAYWTDADLGESGWEAPRRLERCATCGACARACPNGCIRDARFLIDASRCLTAFNEGSGSFPSWVGSEAHSAAIGCLRCQEACPENAPFWKAVERRIFLDRESSLGLLEGKPAVTQGKEAAEILRELGLVGEEDKLARNLAALGAPQGAASE